MPDVIAWLAPHLPPRLVRRLGRFQWMGSSAARITARASRGLRTSDVTIAHGVGRGLRFNAAGTFPGYALGTSEPEVQELLRTFLQPGSVVYDIGAGVGFHALIAARLVGPQGRVIAFEPHPPNREAIAHNVEMNGLSNVEVIPRAVSDRIGRVRLLSPSGLDSTCLQVGDVQTFTERELADHADDVHEVETVSIDELVAAHAIPGPSFVKIDVEGVETQVLKGMASTLELFSPVILCETHGTEKVVVEALREADYRVSLTSNSSDNRPHVLARRSSSEPIRDGSAHSTA